HTKCCSESRRLCARAYGYFSVTYYLTIFRRTRVSASRLIQTLIYCLQIGSVGLRPNGAFKIIDSSKNLLQLQIYSSLKEQQLGQTTTIISF
ncbi:hypothetical protein M5D96_013097, partial [Drosophila gunungcola]